MRDQQTMETAQPEPEPAPDSPFDVRKELAEHFICGGGLEIGALYSPLNVPPEASVTYVDRLTVERLRGEYPEWAELEFTPVDIVDDGEQLVAVADESQDFIVANHFLEHCEDPIGTIGNHLRKLKPGGILFYAVPDKRYTFDFRRPITPLEHMISDHEEGPERWRSDHYDEWVRLVGGATGAGAEDHARDLEAASSSIHMHVWTQAEFLELVLHCRRRFANAFEIEAFARCSLEVVVVLRKSSQAELAGSRELGVPHSEKRQDEARREIAQLTSRLEGTRRILDDVLNSPSWRLTAPLRNLKKLLG